MITNQESACKSTTSKVSNIIPYIRSDRQRRALTALANHDGLGAKELKDIAGVLNVPDLMAQLRRNGWHWSCELVDFTDRDGKKCRPGIYRLTPEHRQLAAKILRLNERAQA